MSRRSRRRGSWAGCVVAIVVRPALWATALRLVVGLARPGWSTSWPPIPTPDANYLRFRMLTAYGDDRAAPVPADAVTYIGWCRDWRATIAR